MVAGQKTAIGGESPRKGSADQIDLSQQPLQPQHPAPARTGGAEIERRIDEQRRLMQAAHLLQGDEIRGLAIGVGHRLHHHQNTGIRFLRTDLLEMVEDRGRGEVMREMHLAGRDLREIAEAGSRKAVEDDMVSRLHEGAEQRMKRIRPRREHQRVPHRQEGGHPLLQRDDKRCQAHHRRRSGGMNAEARRGILRRRQHLGMGGDVQRVERGEIDARKHPSPAVLRQRPRTDPHRVHLAGRIEPVAEPRVQPVAQRLPPLQQVAVGCVVKIAGNACQTVGQEGRHDLTHLMVGPGRARELGMQFILHLFPGNATSQPVNRARVSMKRSAR